MSQGSGDSELQLVTFLMDGEEYGVDVMQVKEVICLPEITPSHNSRPHVEGMINLRGTVVPVINLRKRLGLPLVEYDLDTRVAVMAFGSGLVAFIIDRVSDVMRVKRSEIQPVSSGLSQEWISGILNLEKLVMVVDLEKLGVV